MDQANILNEAIDFHHPGDVALALENGADPNQLHLSIVADQWVPALGRAWHEHIRASWPVDQELFQALISGGACINDQHGRRVFKSAVDTADLATIRLMFDHGFDLCGDMTPLYTLDLDVLTYLVGVQKIDINSSFDRRGTPLHHAIKFQRQDLVSFLLDHNAHIEVIDFYGNTPLLTAAEYQSHDLIEVLLASGADPTAANFMGNTVLHLVNDTDAASLLLAHGADPIAINHCGFAPLDCGNTRTIAVLEAWLLDLATVLPISLTTSRRL